MGDLTTTQLFLFSLLGLFVGVPFLAGFEAVIGDDLFITPILSLACVITVIVTAVQLILGLG